MFQEPARSLRWLFVYCALASALLLPTASAEQTACGALRGTVSTYDTKEPLPGAIITIRAPSLESPKSTQAKEGGTFCQDGISPGTYTVTVFLEGFASIKREFEILQDKIHVMDVELEAQFSECAKMH